MLSFPMRESDSEAVFLGREAPIFFFVPSLLRVKSFLLRDFAALRETPIFATHPALVRIPLLRGLTSARHESHRLRITLV